MDKLAGIEKIAANLSINPRFAKVSGCFFYTNLQVKFLNHIQFVI